MFLKQRPQASSGKKRAPLPTALSVLALVAVAAFVAVVAVAPFTTESAMADEVEPLKPGEKLNQQLMTEATIAAKFSIERFEEEVLPEPKPQATAATAATAARASAPAAGTPDPGSAQAIAMGYVGGGAEYNCLVALWNKESRWNVYAHNSSSGAYGIPQAVPGSKMASAGADWATNPDTQIRWGLGYIQGRYGSPCAAWATSQSQGWY